MNAECIIEQSLLLNATVEIHARSLLKRHTCLIAFLQLQSGQSHVQVSILSQCILRTGCLTQMRQRLGIDSRIKITHTQLIHGQTGRHLLRFVVAFQRLDGSRIIFLSVSRLTGDTVHLSRILLFRIQSQISICHLSGLCIISLNQVNVGNIIRCQFLELPVILHLTESLQGGIIFLLYVINISQVVHRIVMEVLTRLFQHGEPESRILQFTDFQVRRTHTQGTGIAFFIG